MPKTLRELEKQPTIFDRLKNKPLDQLFGEVIQLWHDAFTPKSAFQAQPPGDNEPPPSEKGTS